MGRSQHTRAGLGAVGGAFIVLLTPAAAAQRGSSVSVDWSAPDDCSVGSQVEARIRERIARLETSGAIDVVARLTRRGAHGYRVQLRLAGALSGERRLDAESCDAAVEATALLVAIAIDPQRAAADAPTETAPPDAAPPDAAPPDAATADTAPHTETAAEPVHRDATEAPAADVGSRDDGDEALAVRLALGTGVTADSGTTPGITLGALLSASLSIDRMLLTLTATALLPRDTTIATGAALTAGWMSAALDGCYLLGATIEWGPCVGAEAGRLARSSRGLVAADNSTETVIFASGGLITRAQLTPAIYAALWLGMRTPISYPRLLVAGVGEAFRPTVLGVRATLMLTVVLG